MRNKARDIGVLLTVVFAVLGLLLFLHYLLLVLFFISPLLVYLAILNGVNEGLKRSGKQAIRRAVKPVLATAAIIGTILWTAFFLAEIYPTVMRMAI